MQAIIERTAVFVAKQGKQMEILVKAKQSGNRQFDFLLMDNWLNPYYKHVLQYVTEGKYVPEIPNTSTAQTQEETKETKESDKEDSEDDSDGEYELHPLLQASLHKKITRSQPTLASSSPPAQALGNKFSQTFAPVTSGLNSTVFPHDHDGTNITDLSGADTTYDYSMWYPQDDVQGLYVPSAGYSYHPLVLPVPSVADMIPPPPPPPGEGPLEEEWLEASSSVPPLPPPPPPPPPVPPGLLLPEAVETPGVCAPSSSLGVSSMSQLPQPIIPPPPDLQPIVDKLAIYVAKNGPDFESIIIAKNDPRFDFLDPWNTHHSYYKLKKQEAERQLQLEKAVKAQENQKNLPEVSKGPISFSIKTKVPKKPKIEYRTSVIYKQSLEQEESDEDGAAEVSGAERQGKDEGNGKQPEENTSNEEKQQAEDEMAGDSLSQQMDSIKAAERIAQNLESESRDKQLQLERRRKASLFISMLKKTNPADELEANESSPEDSIKRTRKFMEARFDFPPEKKIRTDSDGYEDDLSSGGVGAPSAGSIRVTQDLMAKVLAASKNK